MYSGDVGSDLEPLEIQQASLGNHVLCNFQGTEQKMEFDMSIKEFPKHVNNNNNNNNEYKDRPYWALHTHYI